MRRWWQTNPRNFEWLFIEMKLAEKAWKEKVKRFPVLAKANLTK